MQNVRNWRIETRVDGVDPRITGPWTKDGGFSMTIYQRRRGASETVAKISGFVDGDKLSLTVRVNDTRGGLPIIATFDTER